MPLDDKVKEEISEAFALYDNEVSSAGYQKKRKKNTHTHTRNAAACRPSLAFLRFISDHIYIFIKEAIREHHEQNMFIFIYINTQQRSNLHFCRHTIKNTNTHTHTHTGHRKIKWKSVCECL